MLEILSRISMVVVAVLAFTGVASAVTLPPVTSGLKVALMADAGVVISTGTSVSQWTDQSGNGNSVFQGTTLNQPTVNANQLNGLPVIHFDGDVTNHGSFNGDGADYMQSTNSIASMISNNAYTTFVVFKANIIFRNQTAAAYVNDSVYGDTGGYMGLFMRSGGPQLINYNYDGNEDDAIVAPTVGQFQIVTARHDTGNLYLDVLGGPSASVLSGNTGSLTGVLGLSGGFNLTQTIFRGDIAELLIYNTALGLPERTQVQNYLNNKYALLPEPTSAGVVVLVGVLSIASTRGRMRRHSGSFISLLLVAVFGFAGVASAVTLPTTGLKVHLEADAGVSTVLGTMTWADQSGNGNDVSQSDGTRQPTVVAGPNGMSAMHFDGDTAAGGIHADNMVSANSIGGMISSSAYTTYAVYRASTVFRNTTFGWTNDAVFADTDGYMGLFLRKTGTLPAASMYAYNFSGITDYQTQVPTTIGQYNIVSTRLDTNVVYLDVAGGPSSFIATGPTGISGKLGIGIGLVDSQTIFRGDIAELLIYNSALNPTDRAAVVSYLNEKYLLLPEPSSVAALMLVTAVGALRRRSRGM